MKTELTEQNKEQPEFSKIPGFEVLEKLPEEKLECTYNSQFYSSLSNLKFLSMAIPEENKLFYKFEQNENASVTSTTGQILKTYQDLFIENEGIKKILKLIRKDITNIFGDYEGVDETVKDMVKPEIEGMEKRLQNYLVEQKTENFRLIKELAKLEKEKAEIEKGIKLALVRLEKLEQEVGNRNNITMDKKNNSLPYNTGETSQNMIAVDVDDNKI